MTAQQYNFPGGYTFWKSIPRMLKQVKDPIGTMVESMATFNGTYRVFLGSLKYIVTQDPAFIDHVLRVNHRNYHKSPLQSERLGKFLGNGLLTSNGEYWLRQRRLIQPGFHTEKIHALYEIIGKTVDRFLERFPTGKQNVYPHTNGLAFEIVINTLFNIELPQRVRDELSSFVNETQAFIIKDIRQPYKSWWFKINGEERHNLKLSAGARDIIRNMIRERKRSMARCNDLLDMLLDARYEDTGDAMNDDQIIDEILVLIIAGYETTANALAWTLYLLGCNETEQERLRDTTRDLSLQDSVTHELLNNVIKESMRLYPPAWISDRIALADDSFGDFSFPKNTIVILFYYGLHRDGKFWDDPEAFRPDRFLKQNFDKNKARAYVPFGAGPRLCIGNNFAMAEMVIFLQKFVKNFKIRATDIQPKLNPLITLKPDKIVLEIEKTLTLS